MDKISVQLSKEERTGLCRAATRPGEDRVSEDGLTDVRAYARVNEVSGTHP